MPKIKLKLFFRDKGYRWIILHCLKWKIRSLPGIRQIADWYIYWSMFKKMDNISLWDCYVEMKRSEERAKKTLFTNALIRLQMVIKAKPGAKAKEQFQQIKQEVLESELLNSRELSEFKEWVQQITPDEKDDAKIQAVIDELIKVD